VLFATTKTETKTKKNAAKLCIDYYNHKKGRKVKFRGRRTIEITRDEL